MQALCGEPFFWDRPLRSSIQEMFCIYWALITMVSEHNKALSPFIHLRFWERLGFGELHGADTKALIVLEAEGRTCPFQRRGSRQEKSLLWSGYIYIKKKKRPIALSARPGQEVGTRTAERWHLRDWGCPGGQREPGTPGHALASAIC